MKGQEIVNLVKGTPQVLSMVYTDLAQPGVQKVGTALGTVLEFSTSLLLPIKLLNEKFRLNFEKNLNDYKKKIESIPEEELIEVNPQIGTPIIEKLSYTTNEEIADLFTNILAMASSSKNVNLAHPGFVQLIERLSVDEARIVKHLVGKDFVPCVTFRAYTKNETGGFIELLKNATLIQFEVELLFPQNISTYLDNLVSIGILDVNHGLHKMNKKVYEPLLEKYEFERVKTEHVDKGHFKNIECTNGYYQITNFGKSFINSCTKK